jgi:D-alanyl-D-alanine carboxypeptidase
MGRAVRSRMFKTLGFALFAIFLLSSVTKILPDQEKTIDWHPVKQTDSLWLVVNKQLPLNPIDYVPNDLVTPQFGSLKSNPYGRKLRKEASSAAYKLAKAMKAAGSGSLVIQSAYRSYSEQTAIHDRQVKRYGLKVGEALAARPGYSEHQTGWAMDVSARGQGCQIRVCFGQTKAGTWLRENSYKYGFIIRYPDYATPTTGYQYEPWHLRYVGRRLARVMHDDKVPILEKIFGLSAAPNY